MLFNWSFAAKVCFALMDIFETFFCCKVKSPVSVGIGEPDVIGMQLESLPDVVDAILGHVEQEPHRGKLLRMSETC